MTQQRNVSRRSFLRQAGLSGLALTIGSYWPMQGETSGDIIRVNNTDAAAINLMAWISISTDGKVTIFNHRSEMGQGTFQAIPQIIAEELEVNMNDVSVQSVAANAGKYGPQPQEGSFSIRGWYQQLLRVGASARYMLVEAAAKKWGITGADCYALNGEVINKASGEKLSYGALVQDASKLEPPKDIVLKDRKDYRVIGKPLLRKDAALKVNGSAVFGLDKKLPGMLYAVVERCPYYRGKVKSFDDSAAKTISGVQHVFVVQRVVWGMMHEGVAVVANSLWTAMKARKLLRVAWNIDAVDPVNSEQLSERMHKDLKKPIPSAVFDTALANAVSKIEAVYEVPYQSHSCMEPLNCIADVKENSIDIWGPVQEANWIQEDLSERFKMPKENVKVNMTFLGGGFGRKAFLDYPMEAAMISKKINAPVQVMWTREDDMTAGPFRSGAVYLCRGGIDAQKKIAAIQGITASPYMGGGEEKDAIPQPVSENKGRLDGMPADYFEHIPHYSFSGVVTKSQIPTMWWRAPNANVEAFPGECFIDELAHLAGQDALAFRKAHLGAPRYLALANKLEAVSNWNTKMPGQGIGIAITECFGSMVGQVVKVSRDKTKKIKIDKVYAVIDCGWYVNPGIIHAQVEGSIVMAIGAALNHATHFKDGKAVENNFHNYRMPRMFEIPPIEVHIMENDEKPGGVGEPGLPAFAPALCNAIFNLTGKRVRKLPFSLKDV